MTEIAPSAENKVTLSGQTWVAIISVVVTLAITFAAWCYHIQSQIAALDKRITVREANAYTAKDALKMTETITDLTVTVAKLSDSVIRLTAEVAELSKSHAQNREAMIRLEAKIPKLQGGKYSR